MSPELRTAIQERMNLGYSKEDIRAELRAAGYDEATIEMVYRDVAGDNEVSDVPPAHAIPQSEVQSTSSLSAGGSVELPRVMDMFQQGWSFVTRRPDLLVYLSIPNLISGLSEFYYGGQESVLVGAISLFTAIAYFIVLAMLLYTVTQKDREVTINEAFGWVKSHAGGYLWILILTMLVVWGGFLLLIIPGLILGVYLSLSQYAFVVEDKRGFAALKRSHELVRGYWWSVAGRIFLLALLTILIVFTVFFVIALVISGFGQGADLFMQLGSAIVGAGATMIFFHAYNRIFTQLAGAKPMTPDTGGKGMYITFAILGLFFPVLMVITIGALLTSGLDTDTVSLQDVRQVQVQMGLAGINAETYRSEKGSYEGVCLEIESTITAADMVRCNDGANAWAVSAQVGSEMWCIDSTGYNKRIEKPLSVRTACLDLP